jgi:hypothetical protein
VDQAQLLGLLALHLALTALPGAAAALFAARSGVRQVPLLLAIGLAATGVVAMLAFWAYYGGHEVGQTFSFFAILGSVLLGGWALWGGQIDRGLLRQLATPLALWSLGSAFVVFLGFVHGAVDNPLGTSGNRFSSPLPSDNYIPEFFADWFFHHAHNGTPPVYTGEWLASDRPPLQMGFVLLQRTFAWDGTGLHYEILGVVLQQLWIVGLWALLLAARVGRRTRALAMLAVLVSDVAIVNGFFVWPKLLPVAMLLAAAALIVTPLWPQVRRSVGAAALVGALLCLAQLGHGASVFGAIPLLLIAALRGLPSWRWLAVAVLAGVALMAPWSAYQSYGDPPGNRLTKWFLGGAVAVDDRGVGEAIVDGYREAGLGGTLHKKGQNFVAIFGGGPMAQSLETAVDAAEAGDFENVVRPLRSIFFFNLVPSLGLLLLGPVAMAVGYGRRRRNPADWSFALTCLTVFGVGAVFWALLQFGGNTAQTVIHQGSFLLPAIGLCGAAAGLCATFPRLAPWFVGFNALFVLAIYAPVFEPQPHTSFAPLSALLAAISLAGFLAVSFGLSVPRRGERRSSSRPRPPSPART